MRGSPEPVFSYQELQRFLAQHLGQSPAKSTLNRWMQAVLDLAPYSPGTPRIYTLEEAIALQYWAESGQETRREPRLKRKSRRIQIYSQRLKEWRSKT